jgi:hypothetical protein
MHFLAILIVIALFASIVIVLVIIIFKAIDAVRLFIVVLMM